MTHASTEETAKRGPAVLQRQAPRVLFIALLTFAIAASAAADEAREEKRLMALALEGLLKGQARVQRIVDPIRIAGAPLCDERLAPVLGIFAIDRGSFADFYKTVYSRGAFVEPFVDAAIAKFDLGKRPKVLQVVPGLAADRAGLKPGDVITAVGGRKVKRHLRLERWANRNPGRSTLELRVDRNGTPKDIEVDVEWGCAIEARFHLDSSDNAFRWFFGDLSGVYFNEGLLRAQPDDDKVALTGGHEIAHFILSSGSSERTEAEADYLGLYLAARAGYDISTAAEKWDERVRKNPFATIDWGVSTHPQSAARAEELQATIAEIEKKLARGSPLVPNAKTWSLDRPALDETRVDARNTQLQAEALERFRLDQQRIANVVYRLSLAGTSVCPEHVAPVVGAVVGRRQDFARSEKKQTQAAFDVNDEVTVFALAEDSPASRAGLLPGDRILAVNGSKVTRTKHVFDEVRKSRSGDPVLRIRRDKNVSEVTLPRTLGCSYGVLVWPGESISAGRHKNDKEIWASTGILRYVADDDELAIELSHQMGHNVLKSFRTADDEPRADELGLRIASLAGFDVSKAPAYWDRKSSVQFWLISSDMGPHNIPHGGMSLRARAIRNTVAELDAAQKPATDSTAP